ncbi:hypothetical protein [Rhodococcoides yunnanense]|uniref:hypothetical protein n=1 Tax=Rhodococcoides yunnanense TaxID=278209 RepID=UPI000932C872|nr:hypothetical protein [Rhodococcus yunnanensis]
MRGDRNHLRLVGHRADISASILEPDNVANVITVHIDNVRPGQVCEVLHGGVFSLSHRVSVPEGRTSITIPTFALAPGRYELSLRVDGTVAPAIDMQTDVVSERAERPKSAVSSGRPSALNHRAGTAGPRSRPHVRPGQIPARSC